SQTPFVHVPGSHVRQVTKPDFLPQVERAAQRSTLPRQFWSSWPERMASRTLPVTQLTYCPWFLSHEHSPRMLSRTVWRFGSLHPALAVDPESTTPAVNTSARASVLIVDLPLARDRTSVRRRGSIPKGNAPRFFVTASPFAGIGSHPRAFRPG